MADVVVVVVWLVPPVALEAVLVVVVVVVAGVHKTRLVAPFLSSLSMVCSLLLCRRHHSHHCHPAPLLVPITLYRCIVVLRCCCCCHGCCHWRAVNIVAVCRLLVCCHRHHHRCHCWKTMMKIGIRKWTRKYARIRKLATRT